MRKKSVEWTTNGRERAGTPYYIIYRGDPPRPVRASQWGLLPSKDTKVYSILSLRDLFALGGREREEGRGERKTEPTQEARAEAKFILIMPSNKEEKTAKRD